MDLPKIEQKILKFWQREKIFQKSLKNRKRCPKFVFYEGPPYANGKPGIHHLLARAFKDIILRYKTMRGFYVERKAGWDTHGLPTEMEAEKKLGIKTKKEIEKIGIEKFIKTCRESVFTYKKEWENFTKRMGYWIDLENSYITCSNEYIESVWWILKQIWKKGLLYQDYKVVPYCPRCGTSLSSHEVAQGYKKIPEIAIFLKFKVKDIKGLRKQKDLKIPTYFLVWTTTPWTLCGNVALAVNPNFSYVIIKIRTRNKEEKLILAKERLKVIDQKYQIVKEIKGKDLLELEYQPIYKVSNVSHKSIYKVIKGDFVSSDEGTGIVHIAPAFGEEDMEAIKNQSSSFPILLTVDESGKMKTPGYKWNNMFIKDADKEIIADLKYRNLLYKKEIYSHDYPFCWRCDTPLIYYAKTSWFIKITSVKKQLVSNNKKINWIPNYLKYGRFGEWLKDIKDWNLSRERFWGTPLPIWQCQKCNNTIIIGSIKELEELSNKKIKDLHRPYIDKITFKCDKCKGVMKRVVEVIDCWFDSGSMPFAQSHFPFAFERPQRLEFKSQNLKKLVKKLNFPADFICEGIDQTRGWFYTLLAISTLLDLGPSYKNVISHGIVLDAKGQKMSKSKGNVISPSEVIEQYGADVARFYFYTINPVGEPKRFDFKDIEDLYRRFFTTLWNVYIFFSTYGEKNISSKFRIQNLCLLDKWIISRLHNLNHKVIENLEKYDVVSSARLIKDFVEELSNWYVRRSRKRFQKPSSEKEKNQACQTLYYVLFYLTKLLAPFCPFISEKLYQNLTKMINRRSFPRSVHLCDYPKPNKKLINPRLEKKMQEIKEIVKQALAQRAKMKIKVRQPLNELQISNYKLKKEKELLELIKEEVNVKKISFGNELILDTKITPELKEEGIVREIIRQIQQMRKDGGLNPKQKIYLRYSGKEFISSIIEKWKEFIKQETNTFKLEQSSKRKERFLVEKEFSMEGENLWIGIKKR
ncbi:isoleucine--tRNA ligase [bacterium]|nr:isoleucine--tRNA ligase [bacterium]